MRALWLVKNGVPFDVAFSIAGGSPFGQAQSHAWSVIFGEFEGGTYDWDRRDWVRKTP